MQDSPAARPQPIDPDWQRRVALAFGDTPVASLAAAIEPGVSIDPLSPAASMPPLWSRAGKGWTRLQRLGRTANAETIAAALETGADGFEIVIAGSASDHGDGLSPEAVPALLALLPLDRCAFRLAAGPAGPALADVLDGAVKAARLDPSLLGIAFGLDPLAAFVAGSAAPAAWASEARSLRATLQRLVESGYHGPFLTADARLVHAAGGTASMELGYALAALLALLRALLDGGADERLAVGAIDVALAADEDQFVTIAKFRAMRLLKARLLAASALPPAALALHGETSWRMLAGEDIQSNVIRATIAALSAGLGGADSLTVLPFTAATGAIDAEAERLALTTQAILIEEAHLARVADPGAGSGTITALTEALAEAAWVEFQAIERDGGLPSAFASGRLQAAIAAASASRAADIAAGRRGIVGVTLFRADGSAARTPAPSPASDPHSLRRQRTAAPFESPAS